VSRVLELAAIDPTPLEALFASYGLRIELVRPGAAIPGSYWGESEAGLRGDTLYARPDTPLHSVLHEAAHYLCMSPARRAQLDRDAGGDDPEETAVCYLQLLLADALPGVGHAALARDMDAWGYSFRLGSTAAWYDADAADARAWLLHRGLIDAHERLTFALACA
jgi:hypothetical protein